MTSTISFSPPVSSAVGLIYGYGGVCYVNGYTTVHYKYCGDGGTLGAATSCNSNIV